MAPRELRASCSSVARRLPSPGARAAGPGARDGFPSDGVRESRGGQRLDSASSRPASLPEPHVGEPRRSPRRLLILQRRQGASASIVSDVPVEPQRLPPPPAACGEARPRGVPYCASREAAAPPRRRARRDLVGRVATEGDESGTCSARRRSARAPLRSDPRQRRRLLRLQDRVRSRSRAGTVSRSPLATSAFPPLASSDRDTGRGESRRPRIRPPWRRRSSSPRRAGRRVRRAARAGRRRTRVHPGGSASASCR
jgi:hypothetical protein